MPGRWFSKRNEIALYLLLSFGTAMAAVDAKLLIDVNKLGHDAQETSATLAKTNEKLSKISDLSESSLGNELLAELSKHPSAAEEIVHILEAKAAQIEVANAADCVELHDRFSKQIQTFKAVPNEENLQRALAAYALLVQLCRSQSQTKAQPKP